ncbi:hypothetical protein E4T43_01408 [Aureobasidium subglaciale]|nr:hypothetical protein E4T43_01408 [Aureobasidium subglaciale]
MARYVDDVETRTIQKDGTSLDRTRLPPNPSPNTQWIGGYKLASGSNGLYKGIYRNLRDKGLDFGADPGAEIGHARPEFRFQKEAYLQGLTTEPNATEEIFSIPLWGYSRQTQNYKDIFPYHYHCRLYMPLYDYGDLDTILKAHRHKRKGIPEPFIWHFLCCMMKAARQLETQAQSHGYARESDVIIPFDMKPKNIFLAPPDSNSSFPAYPRPHIADLGGGCITRDGDVENQQHKQRWAYTRGFLAPEMWRPSDDPHRRAPPNGHILPEGTLRGTHTTVWQIARVAEMLMKLDGSPQNIDYQIGYPDWKMKPNVLTDIGPHPGQDYSMTLRKLVDTCLSFRPEARGTPQQVLDYIEDYGLAECQGMDTLGSDMWFADQQHLKDNAPPPPYTLAQHALDAAEIEKARRIEHAKPYLRAWGPEKTRQFIDLGVLLLESFEVEYTGNAHWWITDPQDLVDDNGGPVIHYDRI